MIRDVLIDYSNKRWMDKILNSINQNYSSAQNFKIVFNFLNQTLNKKHQRLIDLNLSIIDFVIEKLNIQVEKIFSSNLNIKSNKSDRIIEICKKLNCSHYITGSGSANYLKTEEFQKQNIKILNNIFFNEKYFQKGEFIKDLSIIDILFWVKFKKIENLIKEY